jgi:HK97 family phage portal protein
MSVWTRMATWLGVGHQQRAAQLDPVLAALTSRYAGWGGTPVSPESAARKVAVGACVRLISSTARTMPANAYRGRGANTKQLDDPALLVDPDGTGRGIDDWVAQAAWSLAARGNLMAHILTYDGAGRPETVQVLHPDQVYPEVDGDGKLWWKPSNGPRIPGADVIHTRLFPVPGAILGLSPIEQHAATIGAGIAAEKFGSDFFTSGGHPTALLTSEAPMNQTQADRAKKAFMAAAETREPVLMPDGIEYKAIQIAPNESQFLDAQSYSAAECARIFGPGMAETLGYATADSMTYANVIDRDVVLLKYTLDLYLTAIERVLTRCLPRGQYVKLNRNSLLRTSQIDRYRGYEIASRIGLQTPNEQRALEDLPTVPWGAEPYKPAPAAPAAGSPADSAPPTKAASK